MQFGPGQDRAAWFRRCAHSYDRSQGTRSVPIEVITRGERRRPWTPDQKRKIVVESLGPELTPTEVTRRHGIGTGLLYTWRRQVLGARMGLLPRTPPSFARVKTAPFAATTS